MDQNKENYEKIVFRTENDDKQEYFEESAWAIKEDKYYRLDNILFYTYLYSCGDLVRTEFYDGFNYVQEVIEASGNSTLRMVFEDQAVLVKTRKELNNLGCESEYVEEELLLAVNIPKDLSFLKIQKYMEDGFNKDLWDYEEACISEIHQQELP